MNPGKLSDEAGPLLITGPTGVGKSYLTCVLAHAACRADTSVRYFRIPRLIEDLALAGAESRKSALFRALAKVDLIVLDDFALTPPSDAHRRDLLEILDDRYDKKSTLVTSQLPVQQWHAYPAHYFSAGICRRVRPLTCRRRLDKRVRKSQGSRVPLRSRDPL